MSTNLFDAQNAGYVQSLYELYARNPEAVPEAWRRFFAQGPAETVRAGLLVPEALSTNGHGTNGHGANGATATAPSPAARAASAQAEGMDGAKLTRVLGAVAGAT
jgi:2-oxoglutarate dehydrogenase complex dehydrogenase (E1) component-like enzyme